MKKVLCILLTLALLCALAACGGAKQQESKPAADPAPAATEAPKPTEAPAVPAPTPDAEWSREGFFTDAEGNLVSVTYMDDVDEPGWYVGAMIGDVMAGWIIAQEGGTLHGDLNGGEEGAEPYVVTVSEEGADGLLVVVEGGGAYHFTPMDLEPAAYSVTVLTEGVGRVACAEEGEALDLDGERYTFYTIPLYEPTTFTIGAKADEPGWYFVKWTKNGEDYTTDEVFTAEIDGDCEFVAVFDWDAGDGQNPVMNFIGEYACDRARALVECEGSDSARVTIEWGGSVWETARWVMTGYFDPDTLTVEYRDCVKSVVTYDEQGELKSEEIEYENGTGSIVFGEDLRFTWADNQREGDPLVFEWSFDSGEG